MPTLEYIVSGTVQGVGYRYYALRMADRLGVRGFVRNMPTGEVQVVATADQDTLRRLEELLLEGPMMSRVTGVRSCQLPEEDYETFEVRY